MIDIDNSLDAVDVAARTWMTALAMFAAAQPGGYYRAGTNGTSELVTGAPMTFLNGVTSTARNADADEMAAFAASPRLESVAWSVVPPQYRRRGYGRAATAAVLRDAYEEGARTAFLHASPLGVPLYQVMGFRLTENWTLFTA